MREDWCQRRQVVALVFLSCSAPTARARLLRPAHASGDSPWGIRSMPHAAGFLHAFRERWSSTLGSVFRLLRGIRRRLCRGSRALAHGTRRRARTPAGRGRGHSWRRRRGAALNESPLLPSGFRLFPSRSSFSDKRLHGDQRPARQSPRLHP